MSDPIRIRNPYAFRQTERDAIITAVRATSGLTISAWYTDWSRGLNGQRDTATDFIQLDHATKTQHKAVTQTLIVIMRAFIAMHHDAKSWRDPKEETVCTG